MMNEKDELIVENMIQFVEEKEKEIQAAKMGNKSTTKAVQDIMKELEKQIKNAN